MLNKMLSIAVMAAMCYMTVPPAFAQKQNNVPTPPKPVTGSLDPVYRASNLAVLTVWNSPGTKATFLSHIAVVQTAVATAYSHAQANGNNAAANAQKAYVNNLAAELATPSPALVASIQNSMLVYNGILPTSAAVIAFCKSESTRMQPLIAMYNSGGIEAVENYGVAQLATYTAELKRSGRMVNASYHPRMFTDENGPPSAGQLFVDTEMFVAGVLTALSVLFGCEECDGGAALAALAAATVQLCMDLSGIFDSGGTSPQPWMFGSTGCGDMCD